MNKSAIINSLWLGVNKVNTLIGGIVFFALLARVVSVNEYGVFTYSITLISMISVIATLGINTCFTKMFHQEGINQRQLVFKCIRVQLLSAIIIMMVVIVVAHIKDMTYIPILSCMLLFKVSEIVKVAFDSKLESSKYQIVDIIITSVFTGFKILTALHGNIELLCYIFLLESVVLACVLSVLFGKIEITSSGFSISYVEIFKFAIPALIPSVIFIVYSKIDQIMIYNMMSATEQAYYTAALKISEGWVFIPMSIVTSYYVIMSKAFSNSTSYKRSLYEVSRLLSIITISAGVVITLFSSELISLIFTDKYHESASVLTILVWNGIIIAHSAVTFRHLMISNFMRLSFYRAMIGCILNIALNYILIPVYGISGAAIATLISQLFALFLSNVIFKETRFLFYIQIKSLLMIKMKVFK